MVCCEGCGSESMDGDGYCRQCGQELPAIEVLSCECGTEVLPNDNFCHQCGAGFSETIEEADESGEEEEGEHPEDEDTEEEKESTDQPAV